MNLRFYIFAFTIAILFSWSCVPTRHLKGKEKLLYDVTLEGVKRNEAEPIEALYRQKPNRKIAILGVTPYLTVYYWGKSLYNPVKVQRQIDKTETKYAEKIRKAGADSSQIAKLSENRESKLARLTRKKEEGNWLMRSVGEPPSIYDSALTVETASQINTYLSSKGYFNNQVNFQTKERKKKIYLTLQVTKNQPYQFSDIAFNIKDSTVLRLVRNTASESLLKTGQNYDEELLTQERDRLENVLRNQGYYEFRKQYIFFDVDTSFGGNSVRLKTVISNPADSANHKLYKIRNIFFIGEANLDRFGVNRDTVDYGGVKYIWYKKYVSPKVLDKKIRMSAGQPYSLIRTSRTQRQIADLDVYRFSAVNYAIVSDSLQPLLDAYVNVTPAKRYQITDEIGGNFNFSSFAGSNPIPLPYGSLRLKVRNIFSGAENLEFGVRGGLEAQPSSIDDKLVTTTELGGNVSLFFPQFLDPFFKLDHNPKLVIYNPRTRINAAFTYTNREDYNRTNTELSLDYLWQRSQRLQYFVSLVDINIVDATIKSENFRKYLESRKALGVTLIESFKPGVVSSTNATMLYNSNNINQTRDAKYFKLFAEIGNLPGVITGNNTVGFSGWFSEFLSDRTKNTYRSYSFVKFNADYRRYYKLKEKMFFVARGNVGVVRPVPGTNNILPYDKFFFAGGGSSVRAWRPRKLGPGSYTPPLRYKDDNNPVDPVIVNGQPQRDYRPEQPGEILIEGNAEYRFNIFSYMNGALFVDAGNVWTLKDDPGRPGTGLGDFYKEFAVGTGFGLRFDFSFLVVRFDMATKVIDPAEPEGERFVLDRFKLNRFFSPKNMQNSFNLGIGYPF